MRRLRYDFMICVFLAAGVYYLIEAIIGQFLPNTLDDAYIEEHKAVAGEVGGIADETVFRAQNVEDILTHETFTIVSSGNEYINRGSGYYKNGNHIISMKAVTLPSGELVAACINYESVQKTDDGFLSDSILPVGRVVYADLTKDESFMNQIEHSHPLSRTDFYIDMYGEGGVARAKNDLEEKVEMIKMVPAIISFFLFHMLGVRLNIFPRVLPKRNKE